MRFGRWGCYAMEHHCPEHEGGDEDICRCPDCGLSIHRDKEGHWHNEATLTSSDIARLIFAFALLIVIGVTAVSIYFEMR